MTNPDVLQSTESSKLAQMGKSGEMLVRLLAEHFGELDPKADRGQLGPNLFVDSKLGLFAVGKPHIAEIGETVEEFDAIDHRDNEPAPIVRRLN